MKKLAVVLTNNFDDKQFKKSVKFMEDKNYHVDIISFKSKETLKGRNGDVEIVSTLSIDQVDPRNYKGVIIPGGLSPDSLRMDERFVQFIKKFMYKNKLVMSIGQGIKLLINTYTLSGRNVTGDPSLEVDIMNAGANYFDEKVVVCGNLVTSRNLGDMKSFNKLGLKVLKGND